MLNPHPDDLTQLRAIAEPELRDLAAIRYTANTAGIGSTSAKDALALIAEAENLRGEVARLQSERDEARETHEICHRDAVAAIERAEQAEAANRALYEQLKSAKVAEAHALTLRGSRR